MLETIVLDYLELAAKLGQAAFCRELQVPVLIKALGESGESFQSCPTRVLSEEEQTAPTSKLAHLNHRAFLYELHPSQPNPEQRVTIGRSEDNDVVFQDETISSRHAAIVYDPQSGRFALQDLESTNGTMINDRPLVPLRPTPLNDGDVISFGDAVYLFFTPSGLYQALREKLGQGQRA